MQPSAESPDTVGGRRDHEPTAGEPVAADRRGIAAGTGGGGRERRRYPRLGAPVLYRPAPSADAVPRRVVDLSLGGARVYSDERRRPGERLEVEFLPPEAEPFVVRAQVVWVQALAPGGPALYDVGLRFTDGSPADAARLRAVLDQSTQT